MRRAVLLLAALSLVCGCAVGITKTDDTWSAHVVAGEAQIAAGPECPDDSTECSGLQVTGGHASEGFIKGILSPIGAILKVLIAI